jgi:hypothetical protein
MVAARRMTRREGCCGKGKNLLITASENNFNPVGMKSD